MATPPTETVPQATLTGRSDTVIDLRSRFTGPPGSPDRHALSWVAPLTAAVLAASPLAIGYFNFSVWGPLSLVAMVLLIVVAWSTRQTIGRRGVIAGGALCALLALSAASMLWAQSKESAWTETNRLAFYAVLFAIVLFSVRDRRTARVVVMILGLAALATSLWFPIDFILGGGRGAFLGSRLNSPLEYINGTAGLLVMGLWPWMALAETAQGPRIRALALGAATSIAGTCLLTQSRAVIPATLLSAVLLLACAPGRTRRAVKLLVVVGGAALTLPWTLPVYSTPGAAARNLLPAQGLIRAAGVAILFAGVVAVGVSLAMSYLTAQLGQERRQRLTARLGTVMLVTVVVALVGGVVAGHHRISVAYNQFTADKVDESAATRFTDAGGFRYDLWRVAVKEFRQHPLDGEGAGNYDTQYYRLRRNPEYVIQPHSVELQMAAELGIGGLIALLVLCGTVLAAGFARAGTLASTDAFIRIGALGVFSAWLIDTSVDWLYDIPGLAGMALLAAGLLVLPARRESTAARRGRIGQAGLVVGLGVLALLAASVGRQYAASRYASDGAGQIASHPAQALATLRTADRLDPYSLPTLYSIASAYARMDNYQKARDALLVAEQREPDNYVPPALLGDLALRRGDVSTAVRAYRQAAKLDPHDPDVQGSLANAESQLR